MEYGGKWYFLCHYWQRVEQSHVSWKEVNKMYSIPLWHVSQVKGSWPVWTFSWRFKSHCWWKHFLHIEHAYRPALLCKTIKWDVQDFPIKWMFLTGWYYDQWRSCKSFKYKSTLAMLQIRGHNNCQRAWRGVSFGWSISWEI